MVEESIAGAGVPAARGSSVLSVLRWIALLPAAAVGIVAATFPIHWLLMLIYYLKSLPSEDAFMTRDGRPVPFFGIPLETMERLVYSAVLPALFIMIGYRLAPVRKWTVTVSMAVLWAIFMTFALTYAIASERFVWEPSVQNVIALALQAASVIWALVTVYSKDGPYADVSEGS